MSNNFESTINDGSKESQSKGNDTASLSSSALDLMPIEGSRDATVSRASAHMSRSGPDPLYPEPRLTPGKPFRV